MPIWKKAYQKKQGGYYPKAITEFRPMKTEDLAVQLAMSTKASLSDVRAAFKGISDMMHTYMARGFSIHINGIGYLRYGFDAVGVDSLKDFDFKKQVKAVHVEFIPECANLINRDELEWEEVLPHMKDIVPGSGDDDI